jgi:hypothetical protein
MNTPLQHAFRFLALAAFLAAGGSLAAAERYEGTCEISFDAESTLHDFSGIVSNVTVSVLLETNSQGVAVLSTVIPIKPRQLTTFHKKRDGHMYEMFREKTFPTLFVILTNAPLAAAKLAPTFSGSESGTLPVSFAFAGVTNQVTGTIHRQAVLAEGFEFEMLTLISLKAFKLEPHSALFGAITVKDGVQVKTHVKVLKQPPKP